MNITDVAQTTALIAVGRVWQTTGARPLGRLLVRALASPRPMASTVAHMLLVQGGSRVLPLLTGSVSHEHAARVRSDIAASAA